MGQQAVSAGGFQQFDAGIVQLDRTLHDAQAQPKTAGCGLRLAMKAPEHGLASLDRNAGAIVAYIDDGLAVPERDIDIYLAALGV